MDIDEKINRAEENKTHFHLFVFKYVNNELRVSVAGKGPKLMQQRFTQSCSEPSLTEMCHKSCRINRLSRSFHFTN